jgi:glyoxylase-like metal-dependent hydrolase (beta-lactamase superfamily II)
LETVLVEIVPGIHQLQVPIPNNPLGNLNAYLVRGEDGWLLVDTGWNCSEAFHALEEQLQDLGLGFDALSQIVITHVHPDHYGLMGTLTRTCGAKTAMHRDGCVVIEEIARDKHGRAIQVAAQLMANGVPEVEVAMVGGGFTAVRDTLTHLDLPDLVLDGGEMISTGVFNFEVISTPGHAPGHVCLYERDRKILLSGDHILPRITPSVSLVPFHEGNPLGAYLDSLRNTDHLDVDLVLPAHEEVFEDFHGRIAEIIAHHEERLDHALNAVREEAKTAYDIAAEIPWTMDHDAGEAASFAELDGLGRGLATGETMAHLEYLRVACSVVTELKGELVFYRAA